MACFDTAFHATIPDHAATFALPAEWRARWTLRRYGFHGLSHAYVSRRAAEMADGASRIVSCHLGAGASLAAVLDGRSVDTTMGFTPLDGLVMATRSGSVDPGLVLWLQEHAGTPAAELAATLEYRSGENSPDIRWRAMAGLGFLGVRPDASRNDAGSGDREIGSPDAPVRSFVISAREDLEIARQVRSVLGD